MSAFLLLIVCPLLGALFARQRWMPEESFGVLNAWLLRVAFPALVLERVPTLSFDRALVFAALAPWVVLLGSALLLGALGRRLGWSRASTGALVLTCGLGNTAFIGLPMIQALIGPQALGAALIADQLGSFLGLSTVGVALAAAYAGDRLSPGIIAQRVLRFPPFLALMLALLVGQLGGWPPAVSELLHRLGETLTPIALFVVGLQFRLGALRGRVGLVATGLAWKLLLAPLAVWALALASGSAGGLPATVGVLQAAQGPMITAGILAASHRLDPPLVTLVVGLGILLSFASVPLWFWALG
ncbi:MAG TPA: AEC family transporter [Nevskiaceae bacterium]|nr:AEC family transporter [Nevskiaceae bacterium]